MGRPEDIQIPQKEFIFADKELPFKAALFGFEVTNDSEKKNEEILSRLQVLQTATEPAQIRLEGKIGNPDEKRGSQNVPERIESPFAPYVDSFAQNINLLVQRIRRFNELGFSHTDSLDCFTYQDMILVQTAAMCVEKRDGNYTIQSFLARQGKVEFCGKINEILDRVVCVDAVGASVNVWLALKILRDKFLCHLDNHEDYNLTEGKKGEVNAWTPGDRIILARLLLPPLVEEHKNLGPIRELAAMMLGTFQATLAVGRRDILLNALSGGDLNAAREGGSRLK